MILSKNEILVLEALKLAKKSNAIDLAKKLDLNIDGVKRSIYFLHEKGLVKMNVKKEERLAITKEGELALLHGLEEENIKKYGNRKINEIPEEIRKYLWAMRELGFVKIQDGNAVIISKEYKLKEFLSAIKSNSAETGQIGKKYIDLLKTRNFAKQETVEEITAEITEEGKKFSIEKNESEIGELTSEVIKSKEWKEKRFRPFNLGAMKSINEYSFGKIHPLTIASRKIKDVFVSLGFEEMEGNYIETSFWNFDALFQPQDHPSREMADTFYVQGESNENLQKELIRKVKKSHEKGWNCKWKLEEALKLVLRTHTTALSSRQLHKSKEGKFFSIGRVFRNESIDYKHLAEFHQVEGIIAHKKANFANLLWILKEFYSRLGFKKVRFRPGYFPYTEPSVEIEVYFEEKKEWIELGGAGMFRKEVVKPLGAHYPVLAFGLSLERPLMLLLGLNDIRAFYTNNSRWLASVPSRKLFDEVIE